MPAPRANFECRKCEATYEDLPVSSTRCPVCGWKRGFRRLFDTVNVSTNGHRVAKVLDPMMEPQFTQARAIQDDAKASAQRLEAERVRAIETGTPQQREAIQAATPNGPLRWLGGPGLQQAAASLGINPTAESKIGLDRVPRTESAAFIWPHVRRRVVPGVA